jgi:hypothetical protein
MRGSRSVLPCCLAVLAASCSAPPPTAPNPRDAVVGTWKDDAGSTLEFTRDGQFKWTGRAPRDRAAQAPFLSGKYQIESNTILFEVAPLPFGTERVSVPDWMGMTYADGVSLGFKGKTVTVHVKATVHTEMLWLGGRIEEGEFTRLR